MEFDIRDQDPFIEMENGGPTVFFHFSDIGGLNDKMIGFIDNVNKHSEEITLTVGLPLSHIVDSTIDTFRLWPGFHHHPCDTVVVEEKDRPFFESIKASLLEAAAKIDGIQYKTEKKEANTNAT